MVQLAEQPAEAPNGWFRSMDYYSSEIHARIIGHEYSCYLWEPWRDAVVELGHADAGVTEKFKALFAKHAWSFGTLGFRDLAERFWPDLARDARGRCLAGLASGLRPDFETGDWTAELLPGRMRGYMPAAPIDTAAWMIL
ncbi:MAG: hypothetical protein K8R87_14160 [Verrucomicrobia bacterium]|nr:hypothetical protein [Verrucomicrobiota bacterium]